MRGMIITVLHCRDRKEKGSEGARGREEKEGGKGAWERGERGSAAVEMRGENCKKDVV